MGMPRLRSRARPNLPISFQNPGGFSVSCNSSGIFLAFLSNLLKLHLFKQCTSRRRFLSETNFHDNHPLFFRFAYIMPKLLQFIRLVWLCLRFMTLWTSFALFRHFFSLDSIYVCSNERQIYICLGRDGTFYIRYCLIQQLKWSILRHLERTGISHRLNLGELPSISSISI